MKRLSDWRDRIEMLTPPLPWDRPQWRRGEGPPVVLLHGLWRSWRAMQPLARALEREGFSTLNLPYPSAKLPIATLADYVREQVAKLAGDEPVHFITHSMGGILARVILAEPVPWKTGRVVMLAPPNRGSKIVDWSSKHPWIYQLLGPAGRSLTQSGAHCEFPELPSNIEAAVIMGNRCSLPVFRNLLEAENDGIVSATDGHLAGLKGFSVIHADHTFIQMHPEAIKRSVYFLKTGAWIS